MFGVVGRNSRAILSACRTFRVSRCYATREIDDNFEQDPQFASGKTQVTMINKGDDAIFIDAYSTNGFRLNSGLRVMGPTAFFPKSVLHWNVKDVTDINEETLSLFGVLEPKLDILVIGVGAQGELSRIPKELYTFLLSNKMNFEILSTSQALATFNFLNSERRAVAGAMIPPHFMENLEGRDVFTSKFEQGENPMMTTTSYSYVDSTKGDLEGLTMSDTKKNIENWRERQAAKGNRQKDPPDS